MEPAKAHAFYTTLGTDCAGVDMLRLSFSLDTGKRGRNGGQWGFTVCSVRGWDGNGTYLLQNAAKATEMGRDGMGGGGLKGGTYTLGKAPWTALDVCALQLLFLPLGRVGLSLIHSPPDCRVGGDGDGQSAMGSIQQHRLSLVGSKQHL